MGNEYTRNKFRKFYATKKVSLGVFGKAINPGEFIEYDGTIAKWQGEEKVFSALRGAIAVGWMTLDATAPKKAPKNDPKKASKKAPKKASKSTTNVTEGPRVVGKVFSKVATQTRDGVITATTEAGVKTASDLKVTPAASTNGRVVGKIRSRGSNSVDVSKVSNPDEMYRPRPAVEVLMPIVADTVAEAVSALESHNVLSTPEADKVMSKAASEEATTATTATTAQANVKAA